MALLIWKNEYSIDNEELDNHHQMLFDIFNRLYYNSLYTNNVDYLDPIIDELASYSDYHFAAEEEYMRTRGYGEIERHVGEHDMFREKISRLRRERNSSDMALSPELIVYLGNWLRHHVMVEDRKISIPMK